MRGYLAATPTFKASAATASAALGAGGAASTRPPQSAPLGAVIASSVCRWYEEAKEAAMRGDVVRLCCSLAGFLMQQACSVPERSQSHVSSLLSGWDLGRSVQASRMYEISGSYCHTEAQCSARAVLLRRARAATPTAAYCAKRGLGHSHILGLPLLHSATVVQTISVAYMEGILVLL